MAGFNPNKSRDVDIVIEDIDTDIEDDYDEDNYDEDDAIYNAARKRGINKSSTTFDEDDEDGDRPNKKIVRNKIQNNSNDKTVIYVACGVVVLVLIVVIIFFVNSSKKREQELLLLQQQQEQQTQNNSNTNEVKPGIPNFYGVGEEQNDEYMYDPSLITKDLNGNQVSPDYVVVDSQEVTDYINYKKFRSPTGNGLEFYWLEAEYKGQPYKVQVPYSVYSKLDYSGITVVDMEVLTLEDNSKMITYMTVREDAKSLLESR